MSSLKKLSATSGIFIVVFILSIASAQNEIELSSENDLESMDQIQVLLRNVQIVYDMKVASKVRQGAVEEEEEMGGDNDVHADRLECGCHSLQCYCCKHIHVSMLRLNVKCCLSVTYIPHDIGIRISLKLGSRTLFSKEVSARNPPPVCTGLLRSKLGGKVCIQLYNLNIDGRRVSGCAKFLAKIFYVPVANIDLGCFHMSFLNTTQEAGAVELPYLDEQQAPVEDTEPLYLGEVHMEKIKPSGYKKN